MEIHACAGFNGSYGSGAAGGEKSERRVSMDIVEHVLTSLCFSPLRSQDAVKHFFGIRGSALVEDAIDSVGEGDDVNMAEVD